MQPLCPLRHIPAERGTDVCVYIREREKERERWGRRMKTAMLVLWSKVESFVFVVALKKADLCILFSIL